MSDNKFAGSFATFDEAGPFTEEDFEKICDLHKRDMPGNMIFMGGLAGDSSFAHLDLDNLDLDDESLRGDPIGDPADYARRAPKGCLE